MTRSKYRIFMNEENAVTCLTRLEVGESIIDDYNVRKQKKRLLSASR